MTVEGLCHLFLMDPSRLEAIFDFGAAILS